MFSFFCQWEGTGLAVHRSHHGNKDHMSKSFDLGRIQAGVFEMRNSCLVNADKQLVPSLLRHFRKGRRSGRLSVSVGMRRWRSSARAASRSWTTSELNFARPGPALTALHLNRLHTMKGLFSKEYTGGIWVIMWWFNHLQSVVSACSKRRFMEVFLSSGYTVSIASHRTTNGMYHVCVAVVSAADGAGGRVEEEVWSDVGLC